MGVDSGLPDFRGNEGFWNAYPPFKERGLSFYDLADPVWFTNNPSQAWGFYGHLSNLYSATTPHEGFKLLLKLAQACAGGYFVFTSNVDGHFQKSGFDPDRVLECHGTIGRHQCRDRCSRQTWCSEDLAISIDEETFLANEPLPKCIHCGQLARPNILMFNDGGWIVDHAEEQNRKYARWLQSIPSHAKLVMIEIGAGTAVPSVRREMKRRLSEFPNSTLVRINPRESFGPQRTVSIDDSGLKTLRAVEAAL